jgi:hypothetical protein
VLTALAASSKFSSSSYSLDCLLSSSFLSTLLLRGGRGATEIYDNNCGVVRGIAKSTKTKTILRGGKGGYRNLRQQCWVVRGIEKSTKTKTLLSCTVGW